MMGIFAELSRSGLIRESSMEGVGSTFCDVDIGNENTMSLARNALSTPPLGRFLGGGIRMLSMSTSGASWLMVTAQRRCRGDERLLCDRML